MNLYPSLFTQHHCECVNAYSQEKHALQVQRLFFTHTWLFWTLVNHHVDPANCYSLCSLLHLLSLPNTLCTPAKDANMSPLCSALLAKDIAMPHCHDHVGAEECQQYPLVTFSTPHQRHSDAYGAWQC